MRGEEGEAYSELSRQTFCALGAEDRGKILAGYLKAATDPGKRHDLEIEFGKSQVELANAKRQVAELKDKVKSLEDRVNKAALELHALEEQRYAPSPNKKAATTDNF